METLNEPEVIAISASEALDNACEPSLPQQQATDSADQADEVPSLEALLDEAEQRGYLRGRNEAVSLEMQRPSQWENITGNESSDTGQPLILNNMRRSVWD